MVQQSLGVNGYKNIEIFNGNGNGQQEAGNLQKTVAKTSKVFFYRGCLTGDGIVKTICANLMLNLSILEAKSKGMNLAL